MRNERIQSLIKLSHELGVEERGLAILGEGNTSAKIDDQTFLVKASGTSLSTLTENDVVECRFDKVLPLLDKDELTDVDVDRVLLDARVDKNARKPSVETIFHAYLLTLPGINFVGHTHSITVCQIVSSPRAREFAENRLAPDEIVCCGVASVYVPYTDPGLYLAKAIRAHTEEFIRKYQRQPRLILMQNHGMIALGPTWQSVLATSLMAEKAARIFLGASLLGGPTFLPKDTILRIAGRPDELYRQRAMGL